jgi:carbonic anhydrase/acetyltransferase-like protein (isoleucine patch superfamily)
MGKKYELLANQDGLYRIRALRSFSNVREGDVGGFVASELNLSHHRNCWIYGNAKVYDNAKIYGNAVVAGGARVFDEAQVYGTAHVYNEAHIYGNARVSDKAKVYGSAHIYGTALIHGEAQVRGCAAIYDYATVGGYAKVYGDAKVRGHAYIGGTARVYNHAIVRDYMTVMFSHCTTDISLRENLPMSIKCQTGLETVEGHVYGFKHVREDLSSMYDPEFKYQVGEYAEVEEYDSDPSVPCTNGLHVSNATYWENRDGKKVIMVKIALDDIIAVQKGKIRCKKLFVIGICDSEVF